VRWADNSGASETRQGGTRVQMNLKIEGSTAQSF
jgi:hypothetical protein